jgi:hypothetical protein
MASDQSSLSPPLRILFWLLLVVFVLSSLFWIAFFPYCPERVYAAVPPGAAFVTKHENLAERWPELSGHPVVRNAIEVFGGDRETLDSLADPKTVELVGKMASRTTVFGYVPGRRFGEGDFIVAATWIGAYGQFLQWGFLDKSLSDFERVELDGGISLWSLKGGVNDGALSLTFCVFEGVLVACLSDNPLAAAGLRHRLKLGTAPLGVLQSSGDDSDMAWLMASDIHERLSGKAAASLKISAVREDAIEIRALGNSDWRPDGSCDGEEVAGLGSLFPEPPDLFASFCMSEIRRMLDSKDEENSARKSFAPLLGSVPDAAPGFIWMSGGEYSGRLLKLKVPTIIAGTRLREDVDVEKLLAETLDKLNAEYDWGLIPRRVQERELPIFIVEGSRAGGVTIVSEDEKPAIAKWNSWLLISSNVGTLVGLLDGDSASRSGVNRNGGSFWLNDIVSREASGYGRMETRSSVTTLKNAKAVYDLALILGDADDHEDSVLEAVDAWLDALNCLGTCTVWMNGQQDGLELVFRLEASDG